MQKVQDIHWVDRRNIEDLIREMGDNYKFIPYVLIFYSKTACHTCSEPVNKFCDIQNDDDKDFKPRWICWECFGKFRFYLDIYGDMKQRKNTITQGLNDYMCKDLINELMKYL